MAASQRALCSNTGLVVGDQNRDYGKKQEGAGMIFKSSGWRRVAARDGISRWQLDTAYPGCKAQSPGMETCSPSQALG